MSHFLPDFIRLHGYAAVFLLMWVETFLPIFPSEMVMPLGGLIASQGQLSLAGVAVAGALGSITGAITWYWIARALGYARFRHLITHYGRITTVTPHEVDLLQRWFERLGSIMVLIGRVVPGVRTAVSIPAGLVRMPFPRFLLLSALGALLSAAILAGAGWLLRDHYDRVEHYLGPVTTTIVGACILLWLVRLALQFRRGRDKA